MKNMYLTLIALFLSMNIVSAVSNYNILLQKKNIDTGEVYSDMFTWANIILQNGNRAQAFGLGLKPNTSYAIIYFGDRFSEGVSHVTCLRKFKTSSMGSFNIFQKYNYTPYTRDNRQQLLGIVLSSDVGCISRRFLHWNPNEYFIAETTF